MIQLDQNELNLEIILALSASCNLLLQTPAPILRFWFISALDLPSTLRAAQQLPVHRLGNIILVQQTKASSLAKGLFQFECLRGHGFTREWQWPAIHAHLRDSVPPHSGFVLTFCGAPYSRPTICNPKSHLALPTKKSWRSASACGKSFRLGHFYKTLYIFFAFPTSTFVASAQQSQHVPPPKNFITIVAVWSWLPALKSVLAQIHSRQMVPFSRPTSHRPQQGRQGAHPWHLRRQFCKPLADHPFAVLFNRSMGCPTQLDISCSHGRIATRICCCGC